MDKKNILKKTLIFSIILFLTDTSVFAQGVTKDVTSLQDSTYTLNFLNPVDLILIILSSLTALFTLLIIILSILVYFGWKNAEDFRRKQKELLIKQKSIIDKAEKDMERNKCQGEKIIKELKTRKDQIKTPEDFEKYKKKTEELINSLEKTIKNTEDRMQNLRISNTSSTP